MTVVRLEAIKMKLVWLLVLLLQIQGDPDQMTASVTMCADEVVYLGVIKLLIAKSII